MIAVKKGDAPATLTNTGSTEVAKLKAAFEEDPGAFRDGTKTHAFKSSVYGAKSVKSALKQAQFDKCFACESPVSAVAHGDVEHFRPKGGFQQKASDPVTKPGYYWLAYRWENLFFSCQICNQTHKKNLFPLRKAADRCLDHTGDLSKEAPLFLDPARDDPRKHIEFVDDVPRGRKNSKRGNATIDGLGLLRDQLQEARRKTFVMAQLLADLAIDESVPAEQRNRVNTRLQEMRLATQPYSAMIDDMLRAKGL